MDHLARHRICSPKTPSPPPRRRPLSFFVSMPSPPHSSQSGPHSRYIFFFLLITVTIITIFASLSTPVLLNSLPRFTATLPKPTDPASGYSLVAACTNRHAMLRHSLISWLSLKLLDEIVIVDWSSHPPLSTLVDDLQNRFYTNSSTDLIPIRTIRVENESSWVLSRAYNLAVRHASYSNLVKLDCDYISQPDFLEQHPKLHEQSPDSRNIFYAGRYTNADDANQVHLNGALLIPKPLFWHVGGYDERIHTYGFDDEDLYSRLSDSGAERLDILYRHIKHIPHTDDRRAQYGIRFPTVQIDMNRLMLEKLSSWNASMKPSEYTTVHSLHNNAKVTLRAIFVPRPLRELIKDEEWVKIRQLALGMRLHDEYRVPWGLISALNIASEEKFLANLVRRRNRINANPDKEQSTIPTFLIIHVQNGLGNRLRSLGSGLAFANATGREPIVIWERDVHFGALFDDLFNRSHASFPVVNEFSLKWPLDGNVKYDKAWADIDFYNYMIKEGVGVKIEHRHNRNMYWKSSAIMNSELTSWESENAGIQSLTIRSDIVSLAEEVYSRGMENVGGVHIRNRTLDNDILGVKNNHKLYDPEDAAIIAKWRAKTSVFNFVDEIDRLLANGTVEQFFIASDTSAVCKFLSSKYDKQVLFIPRNCDGRSAACEKYALADLLVLSKAKILLGSTWSSFTEAAMRFGGPKARLAGTDFGEKPDAER